MKFKNPLTIFRKGRSSPASNEERAVNVDYTSGFGLPYTNKTSPQNVTTALQLSTIYRCVDVISDAIASQTIDILQYNAKDGWFSNPFHKHYYMLNFEPNKSINRYSMMKTFIVRTLLDGNGMIEILRDAIGEPVSLKLIVEPFKMFERFDGSIFYLIGIGENAYLVEGEDMIHLLNFSYNGKIGVSTLTYATNSTDLAIKSEASAAGFFASGANMSGMLQVQGKLTPEKAKDIKASWASAFNIESGQPGGIAVMESGLTFTPVTVNPKDAQMLETRQFNVVELCRFFGVSPSKVFDDKNLTYSNIEAFQLGFLTDTISPWDSKIEAEFNRKLFRPSKRKTEKINLNIDTLLRANMDARANFVSKLFQCGGYTVDEVRTNFTGMPKTENGNIAFVQTNMMPLNNIGKNKQKNTDQNGNKEQGSQDDL